MTDTTDTTDTTEQLRDHLHGLIAAAAQREYEDSITNAGTIDHPDHLGSRIAAEVMALFAPHIEESWEARYSDPHWGDGDEWVSPLTSRDAAVAYVREATKRPGVQVDVFRVLELRTAGERIEVQP